jgi:hypothetical protein
VIGCRLKRISRIVLSLIFLIAVLVAQGPPTGTPKPVPVTGRGTLGTFALWDSETTITNSVITQNFGNIGIGLVAGDGSAKLTVEGGDERGSIFGRTASALSSIYGENTANGAGVWGSSASGPGLRGSSNSGTGVVGESTDGTGVMGTSSSAPGVTGICSARQNCFGIFGRAQVESGFGHGVSGESNAGPDGAGVLGVNTGNGQGVRGSSPGGIGVQGSSNAPDGTGVNGYNLATTGAAYGVSGASNSTGGIGVGGYAGAASGLAIGVNGGSHSPSGVGVNGFNDAGGLAGNFNGGVQINGDLNVTGRKSSLARLENGRVVALYAMESPENWFEDFGESQLQDGVARIDLDPLFAETVNTEAGYHVFLTPNGECQGLYVAAKKGRGFEVRELGKGASAVKFDYRIVARRKGYEIVRLQAIESPVERRVHTVRLNDAMAQKSIALQSK